MVHTQNCGYFYEKLLPCGALGDVDNVKEEDSRYDKIVDKLLNWPEAGYAHWINRLTKVSFSEENIMKRQPKIFLILPLLADIFAISLQPNRTEKLSRDV